jgi:putative membrane protein
MFLTRAEASTIEAHIARIEKRFGVQIVTAVIGKADAYVELPWMAFALGATLAAFAVVVADRLHPDWSTANSALMNTLATLGTGAASALLAVLVPAYARLFLTASRRDVEVHHYAQSLFLRRELFKTRARNAILILVSRFERKVEILPDVGLHDGIGESDWRKVISRMTPSLARSKLADALREGLDALERVLEGKHLPPPQAEAGNELPDRPLDLRGPR